MKLLSFLGAMGVGIFAASWLASLQKRGSAMPGERNTFNMNRRPKGVLNINEASQQEIVQVLGLDAEMADRIVEHRPYPSRLDLLGRMVVPNDVYLTIKDKIVYRTT